MQERILALDVGERRIGVAVSDPLGMIAQSVGLIEHVGWGPDVAKVCEIADRYQTRSVLCGLPLNMDGSAGGQAEKVRAFAKQLENAGFTVSFWDERLTTVTAERALIEGGVRRAARKRLVDKTGCRRDFTGLFGCGDVKEGTNEWNMTRNALSS